MKYTILGMKTPKIAKYIYIIIYYVTVNSK